MAYSSNHYSLKLLWKLGFIYCHFSEIVGWFILTFDYCWASFKHFGLEWLSSDLILVKRNSNSHLIMHQQFQTVFPDGSELGVSGNNGLMTSCSSSTRLKSLFNENNVNKNNTELNRYKPGKRMYRAVRKLVTFLRGGTSKGMFPPMIEMTKR